MSFSLHKMKGARTADKMSEDKENLFQVEDMIEKKLKATNEERNNKECHIKELSRLLETTDFGEETQKKKDLENGVKELSEMVKDIGSGAPGSREDFFNRMLAKLVHKTDDDFENAIDLLYLLSQQDSKDAGRFKLVF